jgi:hypothetical protein
MDRDAKETGLVFVKKPEIRTCAAVQATEIVREGIRGHQAVELGVLLWAKKPLTGGGHQEGRTGEVESGAGWIKDFVANNAASSKRRGTRNALSVAKITANNRTNKVAFVKGAQKGATSVKNNGNNGILGGCMVFIVEFRPIHCHETFRREWHGLSIRAVKRNRRVIAKGPRRGTMMVKGIVGEI